MCFHLNSTSFHFYLFLSVSLSLSPTINITLQNLRSANYYRDSGLCELSDMDRITLPGANNVEAYDGADYLENNCAEEPNKLCEFKRISGKILKTVDSVYQDIASIDECRELCLNSPYR